MEKKISKSDILIREWNKYFERKIMTEFTLAHQRKLDPSEMSANKVLSRGADGRPTSTRAISRKEHIEILEGELGGINLILETIKELE